MKACSRALCVLLLLATNAPASWLEQPAASVIDHSDLVVVGTLTDTCFTLHGGTVDATGTLTLESTLAGPDNLGATVSVHWANFVGLVSPRLEHQQNLGVRCLWFLNRVGNSYEASTYASVVPLTGGGAHTSMVLELRELQSPSPRVQRVLALADEVLSRLQPGLAKPR